MKRLATRSDRTEHHCLLLSEWILMLSGQSQKKFPFCDLVRKACHCEDGAYAAWVTWIAELVFAVSGPCPCRGCRFCEKLIKTLHARLAAVFNDPPTPPLPRQLVRSSYKGQSSFHSSGWQTNEHPISEYSSFHVSITPLGAQAQQSQPFSHSVSNPHDVL